MSLFNSPSALAFHLSDSAPTISKSVAFGKSLDCRYNVMSEGALWLLLTSSAQVSKKLPLSLSTYKLAHKILIKGWLTELVVGVKPGEVNYHRVLHVVLEVFWAEYEVPVQVRKLQMKLNV